MRKLWMGIIALAAASTANAAVVTYTLSYNDNGSGVPTAGQFAIYAQTSPGDNAGIYAYGVDLAPGATFGTLFSNRGNGIVMEDSDDTLERVTLGFTQGTNTDRPLGKFSGLQDLGIGGRPIPIYGIGQIDDSLTAHVPPEHETQVATFGAGATAYKAKFLLARGSWTGAVMPDFERTSVDNKAGVWVNNSGIAVTPGIVEYAYDNLIDPDPTGSFSLDAAATKGQNQAVGGSIAVTGSNHQYSSEVDQLLGDVNIGNAPIATINAADGGSVYVMAKLSGEAAAISSLLGTLTSDVGPEDSQFAALHANYDSQFGPDGFNALFRFANDGNASINWDFGTSGVTVDQLAAVPEPGMLSLLGIAGLGLLARRRRTA